MFDGKFAAIKRVKKRYLLLALVVFGVLNVIYATRSSATEKTQAKTLTRSSKAEYFPPEALIRPSDTDNLQAKKLIRPSDTDNLQAKTLTRPSETESFPSKTLTRPSEVENSQPKTLTRPSETENIQTKTLIRSSETEKLQPETLTRPSETKNTQTKTLIRPSEPKNSQPKTLTRPSETESFLPETLIRPSETENTQLKTLTWPSETESFPPETLIRPSENEKLQPETLTWPSETNILQPKTSTRPSETENFQPETLIRPSASENTSQKTLNQSVKLDASEHIRFADVTNKNESVTIAGSASDVTRSIAAGSGNSTHVGFYPMYCDRKLAKLSDACLCYADFANGSASSMDRKSVKCAMTFHDEGGLGNVIGQYATLLVLSRLNGRPALQHMRMAHFLQNYFPFLSIPVMTEDMMEHLHWEEVVIHDWMDDSYRKFHGPFLHVGGYPSSYTFFKGFEDEIKREFRFKGSIQQRALNVLSDIRRKRKSATFVGVHVRRGDYVKTMTELYRGVLADRKYFIEATDYFRKRYDDAVFLVVSNDMEWCEDNISNEMNDVMFIGNNNGSDFIDDFAILVNCEHSILSLGTFGYFAALFSGGSVVYFTNYTHAQSMWNGIFRYESAYPSQWHAIAADLTLLNEL